MRVVRLANGPNHVDLLGDGGSDLVWRAWRDNNNAHGADYYTFYLAAAAAPDSGGWQLVPIFQNANRTDELDSFRTDMGADCVLSDLRLLRGASDTKAPAVLVIARRDYGESFADWRSVTFTVYQVRVRGEAEDGPLYYFKWMHTLRTKRRFCDVGEAFRQVLGIGPASLEAPDSHQRPNKRLEPTRREGIEMRHSSSAPRGSGAIR